MRKLLLYTPIFAIFLAIIAAVPHNKLQQIIDSGVLNAGIIFGPLSYYEKAQTKLGLEYELLEEFAKQLGVELHLKYYDNYQQLKIDIENHRLDIAAAELSNNASIQKIALSSPSYIEAQHVIIKHRKDKSVSLHKISVSGDAILVIDNSPQHDFLLKLKRTVHHNLNIKPIKNITSFELLEQVQKQIIPYASINSIHFNLKRNYFSHIEQFHIPDGDYRIALALPRTTDLTFYNEVVDYIQYLNQTYQMENYIAQYIATEQNLVTFSTSITFKKELKNTLPKYQNIIKETADAYGIDWLLLAAISFQESRWNPKAISYTNVRGFMMLTRKTAAQMGIKKRTDIKQSLDGGTRYFLKIYNRLPQGIPNTDRLNFALAAYNIGYGHLQDARKLTKTMGKNANLWRDVEQVLPLLAKKEYYSKTRYGYARGFETITYVKRINIYYDMLQWHFWNTKIEQYQAKSEPTPIAVPLSENSKKILQLSAF